MFDLDGVMIDSLVFALQNFNKVLVEYGLPELTLNRFRQVINPSFRITATALGLTTDEQYRKLREGWDRGIVENSSLIKLYDGSDSLLENLYEKECTLMVVTRNKREATFNLMEKFGIKKYFLEKFIITNDDVGKVKPEREHFEYTLKKVGVEARDAICIDDMRENIATANELGIGTIGTTWGYGIFEKPATVELNRCNPDFIANSMKELEEIINSLNKAFDSNA